jgi:hypothetical protein
VLFADPGCVSTFTGPTLSAYHTFLIAALLADRHFGDDGCLDG